MVKLSSMKVCLMFMLCFLLIAALPIFAGGRAESDEKYEVTFGHVEPLHSSTHIGANVFKALVEERSGGRVIVNIHPASELGPGPEQGEMVQAGSIQMAILPAGHLGGLFPQLQIFDIPFLLPGELEKANEVINGPAAEVLFSYMERLDLVGLANFALSYKQLTANRPLRGPQDFRGLTFRTMPSPIIVETYRTLGASPVVIGYHEVYTALQMGTADGQENPYWALGEMRFYEVQDYLMESNHGLFSSTLVANKQWFENLPSDIQQILANTAKEITTVVWKEDQKIDNEFRELVHADPGTEVIILTQAEIDGFRDATQPVRNKYIELAGPGGAEILEAFEREVAKIEN